MSNCRLRADTVAKARHIAGLWQGTKRESIAKCYSPTRLEPACLKGCASIQHDFGIQLTICAQVILKGDALHCQNDPIILYLVPPETPHLVFLAGTLRIQKGSGYACKVWSPSTHNRLP